MKNNFHFLISFLGAVFLSALLVYPAQAVTVAFEDCPDNAVSRGKSDFFCPKLEGAYFPTCCPVAFKTDPVQCYYYKQSSNPKKELSSGSSCDAATGVTTTGIPCCNYGTEPCDTDVVQAPYYQRLFKGKGDGKTCCFDDCPNPDYWYNPIPNPYSYGVTPDHHKAGKTRPPSCATGTNRRPSMINSAVLAGKVSMQTNGWPRDWPSAKSNSSPPAVLI